MMIYMGEPLAEWEAELMTGAILEDNLHSSQGKPLFIEQVFID